MAKKKGLFEVNTLFSREDFNKLSENKQILLWVSFILLTTLMIIARTITSFYTLNVGEISNENIYHEGSTITYISDVKTAAAKSAVESQMEKIYKLDETVTDTALSDLSELVDQLVVIKNSEEEDVSGLYKNALGNLFSDTAYAALLAVTVEQLEQLETSLRAFLQENYAPGVTEDGLDAFNSLLQDEITGDAYNEDEQVILNLFVAITPLNANSLYDETATQAVLEARLSEVKSVQVTVKSGQLVVQKGTVITEEQMEMLTKTGLLEQSKSIFYYLGVFGYVFVVYFLIFIYCRKAFPFYAFDKRGILILGIMINGFLLVAQLIMVLSGSLSGSLYTTLGYLLPLPAMAIISTTLMDQKFSFFLIVSILLFLALMAMNQMHYLLVALVTSLFAIYLVGRVRERYQLVSFGFYISILNILLIVLVGAIGEQSANTIGLGVLIGLISGFLSAVLAVGFIPVLEKHFGLSTPMKLMELANPGHPLIRRLMTEAPGTYYHSILVGNLAEAAADSIGADSLLVRVASYFHDIGKLERPQYFVENQEGMASPHDKLTPSLSTLIITSHVKDGVELAKKYDLPESVISIIREHHGDSILKYFYCKAKEGEKGEAVKPEDFKYPCPKPQTKESAIIMMSDSVQAALQSAQNLSKGHVEAKIHEIIQGKLMEGQFEECNLTFRDLFKVQEAFVGVYESLAHFRIEYPNLPEFKNQKVLTENKNSKGNHQDENNHGEQKKRIAGSAHSKDADSQSVEKGGPDGEYPQSD